MKFKLFCAFAILFELCCYQKKPNFKNNSASMVDPVNVTGKDLIGSIWNNDDIIESCRVVFYFQKDNKFNHFENCEILDSTHGNWNLVDNNITLIEIFSYLDIAENINSSPKIKWVGVIINDTIFLKYTYRWNHLDSNFYAKPDQLDEKLNKLIRVK